MSILSYLALRIITQLGLQKCLKIYRHLYEGNMFSIFLFISLYINAF
jgi:hypothetical protein